jgi:tripartite-type tricarboxylate transporter receptor subunit TctC
MGLGEMEKAEMWYGFFAPGGTPPATIQQLNQILVGALQDASVREKLKTLDVEVAPDTPDAFAKLVRSDYDRWGPVIRSTGFKVGD